MNIKHHTFYDVAPDPTLETAKAGAKAMADFKPDVIISIGGGSAMDAGKIMWTMYEHPEIDFGDLAMRFMDIRKRVYEFPTMGEKAYFVAIPTFSGALNQSIFSLLSATVFIFIKCLTPTFSDTEFPPQDPHPSVKDGANLKLYKSPIPP